jgi:hypothetical protein
MPVLDWRITSKTENDWRAEAYDGDVKLDARGPTEEHLIETAAYLEQKHLDAKAQKLRVKQEREDADRQRHAEEARVDAGLGLDGRLPFTAQEEVEVSKA